MNVELLLKVKEQILREPERLDMSFWARESVCGTVCCIGGWAVALSGGDPVEVDRKCWPEGVFWLAIEMLGLDEGSGDSLFFVVFWPLDFQRRFDECETDAERALVTADYIDYFITQNAERAAHDKSSVCISSADYSPTGW